MIEDIVGLDGGKGALLVRFADKFVAGAPSRIDQLALALEDGRVDEARAVAHALKGSSGSIGAARLSAVFEEIERACIDDARVPARAALARVAPEFAAASAALRGAIQRTQG